LPDAADLDQYALCEKACKIDHILTIGYSGQLYHGRGISLILRIAAVLPRYKFVIIGGNDSDITFWKKKADSLQLENIVFEGFVPHGELRKKLMNIDIFLMPYQQRVAISGNRGNTSEFMSPLKMFEYMASGKPIIASDLPVLREILQHEENALLVECDDVDKWVAAITRLESDKHLCTEIARNARKAIEVKYNWKNRAEQVIDLIEQL